MKQANLYSVRSLIIQASKLNPDRKGAAWWLTRPRSAFQLSLYVLNFLSCHRIYSIRYGDYEAFRIPSLTSKRTIRIRDEGGGAA